MRIKLPIKHLIKDIPFIVLLVNGISVLILSFAEPIDYSATEHVRNAQYVKHMYDYDWVYNLLYEISDLAIIGFMVYYAWRHKFCLYSKVCIVGLGLLSLLNIVHYFLNFEYTQTYAGIILLICLIFAVILKLRK